VPQERPWKGNTLAVSEKHDFLPPGELNDNLNALPQRYKRVRLEGSMYDAAGVKHDVRDSIDDLAAWRKALGEAHQRYTAAEPEKRLADAFKKDLQKPIKDIAASIDALTRAVHEAQQRNPDD